MMRAMMPVVLLMLAACSGGQEEGETPEGSEARQKAALSPPAETPPATEAMATAIPTAIRGRWALEAGDCTAPKGNDLTMLTIDAANLRFYESHGELARVHESGAEHIAADYRFSGEGQTWDRRLRFDLADGGRTLVQRDQDEGAAPETMRYTRCAA